ncbi:hypothetical protein KM043_007985 [Ampulex compressa]|nr:hypothetical protein KM043_007985 [Ampulex compressa]
MRISENIPRVVEDGEKQRSSVSTVVLAGGGGGGGRMVERKRQRARAEREDWYWTWVMAMPRARWVEKRDSIPRKTFIVAPANDQVGIPKALPSGQPDNLKLNERTAHDPNPRGSVPVSGGMDACLRP